MEALDHGGAEFIIHRAGEQKVLGAGNGGHIQAVHPDGRRIAGRGVLDIHGHPVHQAVLHQLHQQLRERAVGIQLDLIAQSLHLGQEGADVLMQQRLTPGDGHPVQHAYPFFQKGQHLLLIRVMGQLLRQDQGGVMAEGTAEVAATGKHRAGHPTGIIQQC